MGRYEAYTHTATGLTYCHDVLSGAIPACKWTKAACRRHLDDLERWQGPDAPYYFDRDEAERVCLFVECLPHIKGEWAKRRESIRLEPWQCFILSALFGWRQTKDSNRRFKTLYLEVARKNAKALALDTAIPTPEGWKTMGELAAGDRVFDPSGRPCNVIATSEVFTDHDCYAVEFSNGETVTADAGHLWETTARVNMVGVRAGREMGRRDGEGVARKVRTTEELFETQTYGARGDRNHSIQMPKPLDLPEAALDIDPYVLGVWLGDGTCHAAHVTCGDEDVAEMRANIEECGYDADSTKYGIAWRIMVRSIEIDLLGDAVRVSKASAENFQRKLRRIGVFGNKHIPARYLRSSFEQRLALLQGLMDTDGTINKNGRVLSFSNINETLILGVSELLSSLGVKHSIRRNQKVCNGRIIPGIAYQVQFMAFRDGLPVFRLARKLNRMRCSDSCSVKPRSQSVQIKSVRRVPSVPTKCIAVDSPSRMFLCGRTMIPTHNSTLLAAIGLFMLAADGEAGAEVYSLATTRQQASIVFRVAQQMAQREAEFRREYGVEVAAHSIRVPEDDGKFEAQSSEDSNLDGLNVHCGIIDELHAHKTRGVWDVIETATGARSQPLVCAITTAGTNRAGICYEQRSYVCDVLNTTLRAHGGLGYRIEGGNVEDDTYLGIIYTLDESDDWTAEDTWRKANPNYGVSVNPEDLQRKCRKAMQRASAQPNFLTKHLDVWVNADSAWMDMLAWTRAGDGALKPEEFRGWRAYIGLDLASKVDICSMVLLFRRGNQYRLFGRHYLPEVAIEDSNNSQYRGWAEREDIIETNGSTVDYDQVEADLREWVSAFGVAQVGYDPGFAWDFCQRMMTAGLPMVELRATVMNYSEPMKTLEATVIDGTLKHDANPAMEWMISNVVCHRDAKDNIYPRKEHEDSKIDGPVAAIVAFAMALRDQDEPSGYRDSGVAFA